MKIYVHGNCQAPALATLLSEALGEAATITSQQVYSLNLDQGAEAYFEQLRSADVILTQPVSDGYRGVDWLASSWILANASPGTKVITFPVIYHRGQLPQCFPMGGMHQGRLAYHDAHAMDYFLKGRTAADFLKDTARSDFLTTAFVESETWRSSLELMRRERAAAVDVSVMDIIASQLDEGQPLLAVNHPARAVLAELGNRILKRLGREERIEADGPAVLDEFIMPPYLSTALALNHAGEGLRMDEVGFGHAWIPRQAFYEGVFDDYRRAGADAIRAAMVPHPEIAAYLKRHESSVSTKSSDQRPLIDAMYSAFFGRLASSHEVLHHAQTINHAGYDAMASAFATTLFALPGAVDDMRSRFSS